MGSKADRYSLLLLYVPSEFSLCYTALPFGQQFRIKLQEFVLLSAELWSLFFSQPSRRGITFHEEPGFVEIETVSETTFILFHLNLSMILSKIFDKFRLVRTGQSILREKKI